MIYATVLNQPIFELDSYVDVNELLRLEKITAMMLAKNKSNFSVAFSGPSNPTLKTWLNDPLHFEVKDSLINCVIPDEYKLLWEGLSHDQQLYYALLVNRGRSLNYGLTLRAISNSSGGNSGKFHLKHLSKHTEDTSFKKDFEFLFDWINKQNIFQEIGRVQFFINPEGNYTPIHRDYADKSLKDQFLWIRFNKQKDFFVYDEETKEKHFVKGYVCTFDNHQWHGGESNDLMGFSLRIDGTFRKDFLNKTGLVNHFCDQ
jgi:hypothetical protein